MATNQLFMKRCFDLARLGAGRVAPNPMVGAVLVHNGRIIGEGFHQAFGKAHAEVNALASVAEADKAFIPESTLYVSLEPCCIHGKTPPCTNLILHSGIRRLVISCIDESPGVNGRGIAILQNAGVEVVVGVLEAEGKALIAPRSVFVKKNRPYIILKWAQTADGFFAPLNRTPFWISNAFSRRLVHKWRSEADAILVGTNTALADDPALDNRYYFGKSPRRVVIDLHGKLKPDLQLLNGQQPTLVVTSTGKRPLQNPSSADYLPLDENNALLPSLLDHLYQKVNTGVLLVEGGAALLEDCIRQGLWDEARIIQGSGVYLQQGIPAPVLPCPPLKREYLGSDRIELFYNLASR